MKGSEMPVTCVNMHQQHHWKCDPFMSIFLVALQFDDINVKSHMSQGCLIPSCLMYNLFKINTNFQSVC